MAEEQKSVEERGKEFLADYQELIKKHGIDTTYIPSFEMQENGLFGLRLTPQLVDISNASIPTPFIEEDKK